MSLKIQSVFDKAFVIFGRVADGYDYRELISVMEKTTPKPLDSVVYVPSEDKLEATSAFKDLRDNVYGGMPIQIGYCNGSNTMLNCLEYHRDSEVNVAVNDVILLVARQQDIVGGVLDTSKVEAFALPKGTAVEIYATTLHYAPCEAVKGEGFRVAIVLPKGTNTDKPSITVKNSEDEYLFACNKWLLAHPNTGEAKQGAYVGLTGENIDIASIIS